MNDIHKIINDYKSCKYTLKELSIKYNKSVYMLNKLLKENNVEKFKKGTYRNNSLKNQEKIISLYEEGTSINELKKIFKTTYHAIKEILLNNNIKIHSKDEYSSKKFANVNYFEKIDTEAKAYILGYLYADGYLFNTKGNSKGISIGLCEKDKYILEFIKNELESEHNILEIKPDDNRYSKDIYYRLSIPKAKIYNDLAKLGLNNKNKMPTIRKDLINHFIRGVFDGDGCISISNSRNECHTYEADIHIMGEENFLKELVNIIHDSTDIRFSKPKFVRNIYRIRKSGPLNAEKFKEYIYKDATIYLQRKYNKFAVLEHNRRKL